MATRFVYLVVLFYTTSAEYDLPSYIKPCHVDKNFEKCVTEQIDASLPYFTKGVPDLGVASIDPLNLDDIRIVSNTLNLTFTETILHGLSSSKLNNFTINFDEEQFTLNFIANLSLSAQYEINGKILILPIQGKGDAKVKAQNTEVRIHSKLFIRKNNTDGGHIKLIVPNYTYDIQKTSFKFKNLFNGNKLLSDATHEFANENWRQLMDDLAPPAIKQIVRTVINNINKFFSKLTVEQIMVGYHYKN